jgi:hypothetical protein
MSGSLPERLSLSRYRLTLVARDPLTLPPYKGSTLRGGFGIHFKRMVCFQPQAKSCKPCLLRHNCPYPYLFESFPPPEAEVLRKNEDVARPLVIEPPLDHRTQYGAGELLTFHLVLVGRAQPLLSYLVVAFQELGRSGLGRARGQFRVARVEAVHPFRDEAAPVYDDAEPDTIRFPRLAVTAAEVEAQAAALPRDQLRIDFRAPTRLVSGGQPVQEPPFSVLVQRLLERISSLSYFHCGERWEIDFRGLIARAQAIDLVESHTGWANVERFSGRQKEWLSLGGLVGDVVYRGDLTPFRSLLLLGSLVHVGKATIFGNGLYEIGA